MGDYLDSHPETNQTLTTMLQQQAGPESVDSLKSYFGANPKVAADMASIAAADQHVDAVQAADQHPPGHGPDAAGGRCRRAARPAARGGPAGPARARCTLPGRHGRTTTAKRSLSSFDRSIQRRIGRAATDPAARCRPGRRRSFQASGGVNAGSGPVGGSSSGSAHSRCGT